MLTSLRSSISLRSRKHTSRGFSLVELTVSIAILVLIISTVVVRFTTFDSLIVLRTLGHEIGLSVRKAQSYSLSVLGSTGDFETPYGVTFTPTNTSYALFAYSGNASRPFYDTGGGNASVLETYTLGSNFRINDVCVIVSSVENCAITRLDISFVRPEFTSLFYVPSFSEPQNAAIEAGVIKIESVRDSTVVGRIEVGYTGQISVTLE